MHHFLYFTKGILIGFSAAVPIGPIGIMCIQLSLFNGKRHGFVSGLGAATADMLFASISVFGVTIISNFLLHNTSIIRSVGGIILLLIGISIFIGKQKSRDLEMQKGNIVHTYLTTFMLTLTNPLTIIAFMTIFALFKIVDGSQGLFSSMLVVAGIFLGSTLWFVFLTSLAAVLKKKLTDKSLHRLNMVLGIVICVFGLVLLINHMVL